MKMTFKLSLLAALLASSGLVAAQQVVKIGHVGPVSGAIAHLGKDNENGARLAIEELNAKGLKIGGQAVKFELVAEDDAGDPKQGTAAAQKLIDQKISEGVITPNLDGKGLAVRLGLSEPSAPKAVPNGTENILSFSVNLELIPSPKLKMKLQFLLDELESNMKAKVIKSPSLESFLAEPEVQLAKAA